MPSSIFLSDESGDAVRRLPVDALKALAEFLDLLALDPWTGLPYREPDSDLRTAVIGDGAVLVVRLPLERQERVEVLRIVGT